MLPIIPSNFSTLDPASQHPNPEDPSYRRISIEHQTAVQVVNARLREAWKSLPPPSSDFSFEFVREYIKKTQKASDADDTKEVHTSWRNALYDQWNNVFYDVGKFLPQICTGDLCHRPPASKVFELCGGGGNGVMKSWDRGVLLMPAFLTGGVEVRAVIVGDDDKEFELGSFGAANQNEIWYVQKGTRVRFDIDGDGDGEDLAAVMVYGELCAMDDEERKQREVESAKMSALLLAMEQRRVKGGAEAK